MKKNVERKEFRVPSDLSEVQKASADALAFLKPLGLGDAHEFDVRLCLEEALINGMKYGNRLDPAKPVIMDVEYDDDEVRIRITDQGQGFDVRHFEDCTSEKNLFKTGGRGIYLIHQLMDEVRYNDKGNSLLMVKRLRSLRRREAPGAG